MAQSELQKLLKAAQKNKEAVVAASKAGGFDVIEDGKYIAQLTKAVLGTSANGREQIVRSWTILEDDVADGKQVGLVKNDFKGITDEASLGYIVRDHGKLGVDIDADDYNLEELVETEQLLVNAPTVAKIQIKTKGEFQNIYILEAIDDYDGELAQEPASDSAEDAAEPETEAAAPPAAKTTKTKAAPAPAPEPDPAPAADDTSGDEDDEEGAAKIGMAVKFESDGKAYKGKISAIDEAAETISVDVKVKKGLKTSIETFTIAADDESLDVDDDAS